jgi:predicted ester cyclase
MTKKSIVKSAIKMIESGKINDNFFADNLVVEGIRPTPMNKKQYVEFLDRLLASVPDLSFNCREIVQKNKDTVAAKVKITGTNTSHFDIPDIPSHPATGKSFKLPEEIVEYKIESNRISKIKASPERINHMINQLGINPFLC